MPAIWPPALLLFLVSIAVVIALVVTGEMLAESKRRRRPVRIPIESERAASAKRQLPRVSLASWHDRRLAAEAIRRVAPD